MDREQVLSEFLYTVVSGHRPKTPKEHEAVTDLRKHLNKEFQEGRFNLTDEQFVEVLLDEDGNIENIAKKKVLSYSTGLGSPDAQTIIKESLIGPDSEFLKKRLQNERNH